jgi:probable HAF family extracellular repeat protein
MKMKTFKIVFAITLFMNVSLANAYISLTILNDLEGGSYVIPTGINDAGQVVGVTTTSHVIGNQGFTTEHALLWNGNTPTELAGPPGSYSNYAYGINNAGQIVGSSYILSSTNRQAVLWNGTSPTVLNGSGGSGVAKGINNSGQIVGNINNGSILNNNSNVIWNGSSTTVLNSGGMAISASGINDSGQVVGTSLSASLLNSQAVMWNGGGTPIALLALGGVSMAHAINNQGSVVGYSLSADYSKQNATLWNGTTAYYLSDLGGGWADALGINNSGQVVGFSQLLDGGPSHAILWTPQNGNMVLTDMNSLIDPALKFTLANATAINNLGQVVGYGINSLGQRQAFMMSVAAIPEPETYAMFLAGLGFMGVAGRRRKVNKSNYTFYVDTDGS